MDDAAGSGAVDVRVFLTDRCYRDGAEKKRLHRATILKQWTRNVNLSCRIKSPTAVAQRRTITTIKIVRTFGEVERTVAHRSDCFHYASSRRAVYMHVEQVCRCRLFIILVD